MLAGLVIVQMLVLNESILEIRALWKHPLLLGITCGITIFLCGLAVSTSIVLWLME